MTDPRISRLRALISKTHQAAAHLKPGRLLNALRALNAKRRAELAKLEHPSKPVATISPAGVAFIKGFEGFVADQYDDGTGTMTIGYGTTAADVNPLPRHLTEHEAAALLKRKLEEKYCPAVRLMHLPFNQNQFDAVTSLVYNVGIGILGTQHDVGRLLRQKNWKAAADSFLEYDHAGGQVLAGLKRRREAERRLFLKP